MSSTWRYSVMVGLSMALAGCGGSGNNNDAASSAPITTTTPTTSEPLPPVSVPSDSTQPASFDQQTWYRYSVRPASYDSDETYLIERNESHIVNRVMYQSSHVFRQKGLPTEAQIVTQHTLLADRLLDGAAQETLDGRDYAVGDVLALDGLQLTYVPYNVQHDKSLQIQVDFTAQDLSGTPLNQLPSQLMAEFTRSAPRNLPAHFATRLLADSTPFPAGASCLRAERQSYNQSFLTFATSQPEVSLGETIEDWEKAAKQWGYQIRSDQWAGLHWAQQQTPADVAGKRQVRVDYREKTYEGVLQEAGTFDRPQNIDQINRLLGQINDVVDRTNLQRKLVDQQNDCDLYNQVAADFIAIRIDQALQRIPQARDVKRITRAGS